MQIPRRPAFKDYVPAYQLIGWAMVNLGIAPPDAPISDQDIRQIMLWIGYNAVDTMYPDDVPKLGRIGIGLMLSVTLLEFPEYYVKYELSQFN